MGKTPCLNDYFKGMGPDGDEEGGPYGPDIFDGAILQLVRVRCGPSDDDFENEVIEVARCDREYDADLLIAKLNEHNRLPEILFNQSARYEAELESLRVELKKAIDDNKRLERQATGAFADRDRWQLVARERLDTIAEANNETSGMKRLLLEPVYKHRIKELEGEVQRLMIVKFNSGSFGPYIFGMDVADGMETTIVSRLEEDGTITIISEDRRRAKGKEGG